MKPEAPGSNPGEGICLRVNHEYLLRLVTIIQALLRLGTMGLGGLKSICVPIYLYYDVQIGQGSGKGMWDAWAGNTDLFSRLAVCRNSLASSLMCVMLRPTWLMWLLSSVCS